MTTSFKMFLRPWMADPARRQRGSVLSGLLIIVTFLSILVGALMSELSSGFLITHVQSTRISTEATVNSAAELGIMKLENTAVPARCASDVSGLAAGRGPWPVNLNDTAAVVSEACSAIVPELEAGLAGGAFNVDGTHEIIGNENEFLVADTTGMLRSYPFGTSSPEWTIGLGGAPTGPLLAVADRSNSPHVALVAPVAKPGYGCNGHCVALYDQVGGNPPSPLCYMPASSTVTQQPAQEVTTGGPARFPSYLFFGDSTGHLYVYDASTASGNCALIEQQSGLGGPIVGDILVFPGAITSHSHDVTTSDEIFFVFTSGQSALLGHWRFSLTITSPRGNCDGNCDVTTTTSLDEVNNPSTISVRSVAGTAVSSHIPIANSTIKMAIASATGRIAIMNIAVGPIGSYSYTPSVGPTKSLAGGVRRSPYWCHCPQQDLIGVGNTNGTLYLLDTNLSTVWSYDGQADGRPAISTTPAADSNGDWYFGADDGYVYDVEIPVSGVQMFKAAGFASGATFPIQSAPVVGGASDSCALGPCLYFGSAGAGSHLVKLGSSRIIDLQACISTGPGSSTCSAGATPKLWARVEVGPAAEPGANVIGWSYSQ